VWNLASELLLKMFELIIFNAFHSHLDHLFDEGIFGDNKLTIEGSEKFADLLNLARADVGEGC